MLRVVEVKTRKQLKCFIEFPYKLYSNNQFWIPPLKFDEMNTLRKDKNPAFEYCYAKYWLAYQDDTLVGRIAGIINRRAIEKWEQNYARFGWFDFIDDLDVAKCLLYKVEAWAKEEGLCGIQGPMGFCDMDKEGMLIEGFDETGTFSTQYNYPYYPKYMELNGYSKDVDWLEFILDVPDNMPENIIKIAEMVEKRNKLKVLSFDKTKDILPYAPAIFKMINETYEALYNVVPLSDEQIEFYVKQYISSINPEFLKIVVDCNDNLAAFGIGIPSLAKALQKTKGQLFPFGFMKILKALKVNDSVDLLLVAVRPDLQGKGVNSLLMKSMAESCWKYGIKQANCNPQLESNLKVQAQWKHFTGKQNKRRRSYFKSI